MKNMLHKFQLTLIIFLSLVAWGSAQTYVAGLISTNTVWSNQGNPYIMTGNVVINSGVTLNIKQGTVIHFRTGVLLRVLSGATLIAQGQVGDSVYFLPDTNGIICNGIRFEGGAISSSTINDTTYQNGSLVDYCVFNNLKSNGSILNVGGIQYPSSNSISLLISHCSFFADSTFGSSSIGGGDASAIHIHFNAIVTINNSLFSSNYNPSNGGSISSWGGNLKIYNSTFLKNIAGNYGGAYYNGNGGSQILIKGCLFKENKALSGGAIGFEYSTNINVENCEFYENVADSDGSAIYDGWRGTFAYDYLFLSNNYFSENKSYGQNSAVVNSNLLNNNKNNYNVFWSNYSTYSIKLHNTNTIQNLKMNFWGVRDSASISNQIYDFYKDPTYSIDQAIFFPFMYTSNISTPGSPTLINSITLYNDSVYSTNINNGINVGDTVYISVLAADSDSLTRGVLPIYIINTSTKDTIFQTLYETSESSGNFIGKFLTSPLTSQTSATLGVKDGQKFIIFSPISPKILQTVTVGPNLSVQTGKVSFGNVAINDSISYQIGLTDSSKFLLNVTGISVQTNNFKIITQTPFNISPYNTNQITVRFLPTTYGSFTDTMDISSSGGDLKILLSGSSPYPVLQLSKNFVNFGHVALDSSFTQRIIIKDSSLNILSIDTIYTKTKEFKVSSSYGNLKSADSLVIDITFTPDFIKSFLDTLYLHNNSLLSLIKIPLLGVIDTPGIATLIFPNTSSVIADTVSSIMFSWNSAKYASSYNLQIGSDKNFGSIITDSAGITDTTWTYHQKNLPMTFYWRVMGSNVAGSGQWSPSMTVSLITGINGISSGIPVVYQLMQNYPNPFNPSSKIRYALPFSSNVKIEVYNLLGEKIKVLVNEQKNAGYYEVNFNTNGVASGVYFYIIEAKSLDGKNEFRDVKKMVLLK